MAEVAYARQVMVSARVLGVVIVALATSCGSRDSDPPPAPVKPPEPEPEWMTKAATAQLIGEDAMPGPLFVGLVLGGPAPTAEAKERIAAFARANHLEVYLDVEGDKLSAIRLDVSYGGCCGYEGADALGLRLKRPKTMDCLHCTWEGWLDDWVRASADLRVVLQASIRVNRVKARWERAITEAELLARADALLGQDYEALGKTAGDRWHELTFEHAYLLEVPYPFDPYVDLVHSGIPLEDRKDLGLRLAIERRKAVEVSFDLSWHDEERAARMFAAAKQRWGREAHDDSELVWRRPDRTITACCSFGIEHLTIAKR